MWCLRRAAVVLPWCLRGTFTGDTRLPWCFRGKSMVLSWKCHGSSMGLLLCFHGVSWFHGAFVVLSCCFRGVFMVNLWYRGSIVLFGGPGKKGTNPMGITHESRLFNVQRRCTQREQTTRTKPVCPPPNPWQILHTFSASPLPRLVEWSPFWLIGIVRLDTSSAADIASSPRSCSTYLPVGSGECDWRSAQWTISGGSHVPYMGAINSTTFHHPDTEASTTLQACE